MPAKKKGPGRGGKRAGAGRPQTKPKQLPWKLIREAAAAGADEGVIVRALGIPDVLLEDAANLTQFRDEIARGLAIYKLELHKTIKQRGRKTTKSAGSVNALALQARNVLEWDKQLPTQEVEPDLGTSRQRLRDLLTKLAQSRTEIEGQTVTALELLHREAEADRQQQAAATAAPA